jgi:hypothetical protein
MSRVLPLTLACLFVSGCADDPTETETGSNELETSTSAAQTTDETTDEPEPPEPDTSSGADSSSDGSEETNGEETGEEGWVPYQACDDQECPEEADECHVYVAHVPVHYCTVFCEDDHECPAPPSGQSEPRCDEYLTYSYCALDCADAFCPSGMGCFDVTLVDGTMVKRCGWVDE